MRSIRSFERCIRAVERSKEGGKCEVKCCRNGRQEFRGRGKRQGVYVLFRRVDACLGSDDGVASCIPLRCSSFFLYNTLFRRSFSFASAVLACGFISKRETRVGKCDVSEAAQGQK